MELITFFLKQSSRKFSLKKLSEEFSVSERQIKNYIFQINQISAPEEMIITLGNNMFQLCDAYHNLLPLYRHSDLLPKDRVSIIISKILTSNDSLDLFDLADELYISRSTLETDLNKVRKIISEFQLKITVSSDTVQLVGSEKSKRRLTSYMITNDNYNDFLSSCNLKYLKSNYKTDFLNSKLSNIFDRYHLVYNDYSLNNIVLHLIITLDRLKDKNELLEQTVTPNDSKEELKMTKEIVDFLKENYNVSFSQTEFHNLLQFISCNLVTVDYRHVDRQNVNSYISPEVISITKEIIQKVQDYYFLDDFDEVFESRFMLHINNLFKRLEHNYSSRNPLAYEIKYTYPLIYDVAVFVADIIYEKKKYKINQDEISFIALHIGGFLESNKQRRNKISAIYIYSDYHSLYRYNIEKIQKQFSEYLDLKYTISINDYYRAKPSSDIIISEFSLTDNKYINVSPFITEKELALINYNIEHLRSQHKLEEFQNNFSCMTSADLFLRNINGKDEFDTIEKLLDCMKPFDIFLPEFPTEVIKREQLSSTAFHNDIAVPHAISQFVKNSFISFACYDNGIPWGNEKVRLVVIIGISYSERKRFRSIFSQLVDILSNASNTNLIINSTSYEELRDNINKIAGSV